MTTRTLLTLMLTLSLSSLLCACGGGGGSSPRDPRSAASLAPAITSYRYTIRTELTGHTRSMSSVQAGTVQLPGREQARWRIQAGGAVLSTERIAVGGRHFVRGDVTPTDLEWLATRNGLEAASNTPDRLAAFLAMRPSLPDVTDGKPSRRYELDRTTLKMLGEHLVPIPLDSAQSFAATLWVCEVYGVPVRLLIDSPLSDGSGRAFHEFTLTDINAAGDTPIQAPAMVQRKGEGDGSRADDTDDDGPSAWDYVTSFFDTVVGVLTGVSPIATGEAVDDAVDASEGIAENIETIEEYVEAYPDAPIVPPASALPEEREGEGKSWVYWAFWGLLGFEPAD